MTAPDSLPIFTPGWLYRLVIFIERLPAPGWLLAALIVVANAVVAHWVAWKQGSAFGL